MRTLTTENVFNVVGRGRVALVPRDCVKDLEIGEVVLLKHINEMALKTVTGIETTQKLMDPPIPGTWAMLVIRDPLMSELPNLAHAFHTSAPPGCICADCSMDKTPCPDCYVIWWAVNHPHVRLVGGLTGMDVEEARERIKKNLEKTH